MCKLELVAVVNSLAPTLGDTLAMVPEPVRWLEVRADLVGDIEPDRVRKHFRGQLLYTLRSSAEGGACHDSEKTRLHRLRWAAQRYDLVDLEGERDLLPELMDAIPPEKRLISWQGLPADTTQFHEQFRKLSNAEARFYKLVSTGDQPGHWLAPLTFLKSLCRSESDV